MADYIGTNFYIKPTYICAFPEYINCSGGRSFNQRQSEINLKENSTKGYLSSKSSRKLMNAVNWLVSSAKDKALYSKKHNKYFYFKINFLTLTIPAYENNLVDEKTAKRCMHAWLAYARKYFYLRNYVWKFEKTEVGQLHIHLTTDTFIHYKRLQQSWNRILNANSLLDKFQAVHGHHNPNSTDVHAVRKVKDVGAYIAKYMSKSQVAMSEYKGRIWACNREISHVNKCQTTIFANESDVSTKFFHNPATRFKEILSPPDKLGMCKRIAEIFFINEQGWKQIQGSVIAQTYNDHRYYIRNNIEALPLEYYESLINEFFDKKTTTNGKTKTNPPDELPKPLASRIIQRRKQRTYAKNIEQSPGLFAKIHEAVACLT